MDVGDFQIEYPFQVVRTVPWALYACHYYTAVVVMTKDVEVSSRYPKTGEVCSNRLNKGDEVRVRYTKWRVPNTLGMREFSSHFLTRNHKVYCVAEESEMEGDTVEEMVLKSIESFLNNPKFLGLASQYEMSL